MTPEGAFQHPFISKAVNELKCLRTNGTESSTARGTGTSSHQPSNELASDTKKQKTNGKNGVGSYSGSGSVNFDNKAPNSARSNQSDVHASLPKISNR